MSSLYYYERAALNILDTKIQNGEFTKSAAHIEYLTSGGPSFGAFFYINYASSDYYYAGIMVGYGSSYRFIYFASYGITKETMAIQK